MIHANLQLLYTLEKRELIVLSNTFEIGCLYNFLTQCLIVFAASLCGAVFNKSNTILTFDKEIEVGCHACMRLCGSDGFGDLSRRCPVDAGDLFMTVDLIQIAIYLFALGILTVPVGRYMANVYRGTLRIGRWKLESLEQRIYRCLGFDPDAEMNWRQYSISVLTFSFLSLVVVYAAQRMQGFLPGNPETFQAIAPDLAFNTAVSFVTNTNWQSYGGESSMSYTTQSAVLTVQNFLSAAVGMSVLVALTRGFRTSSTSSIGNFWIDLHRGVLFILLPFSVFLALLLVSQGVVQSYQSYPQIQILEPGLDSDNRPVTQQTIAIGPAASQIAIKQLGTNGGGFFNANSAHPFENPTPLSNLLEMVAILLLPAALCITFGELVGDRRQGRALLATMFLVFIPLLVGTYSAEVYGKSVLTDWLIEDSMISGGIPNMEGKETRFGVVNSAVWAAATTAASNGSVNAMHDSFTPLGGMFPLWLMQLGEVIFGGVGSGLYGMLAFVIIAVFISGLMVGRTPEYLGKKIEAFEMKMASMVVLLPCACVLLGTALSLVLDSGKVGILNPGPHGLSEVLYAFSSASNNNGSAFAGLSANTLYYNTALALVMLIGRFGVILPILAVAGSLAQKKRTPITSGTLPTHTPLFVTLLIATILIVGALSYFPALALGPIAEHLLLH